MNKLIIPPPPNWFETNIISCAPDNTIVYGSRSDIVIIYPKPENEPADIKVINRCHQDKITSTAIGPNWANPDKLALSFGADKIVSLIDVARAELRKTHCGHRTRTEKVVGATFAGYDKIVSVSEDGFIIIWKWVTNELKALEDLLGAKTKVACLSVCPHASYMIAFGLKKGGIIVADLRKSGHIVHRLKGHDSSVLSLAWCPVPYNVFPEKIPKHTRDAGRETVQLKSKSDLLRIESPNLLDEEDTNSKIADDCSSISLEVDVGRETVEEAISRFAEVEDDNNTISELHAGNGIMEGTINKVVKADDNVLFECNVKEDVKSSTLEDNSIISKNNDVMKSMQEASSSVIKDDSNNTSPASKADKESIKSAESDGETGIQIETGNISTTTEESSSSASPETVDNKEIGFKPEAENTTSREIKASEYGSTTSFLHKVEQLPVTKSDDNSIVPENSVGSHGDSRVEESSEENLNDCVIIQTECHSSVETQNGSANDIQVNGFENKDKKDTKKEYLLASCARNAKSIMIWRALSDGIKHIELNLPNKIGFRNKNRASYSDDKLWIPLCWIAPKILLSSSSKGELLYWNFFKPSVKGSFKWRLIHNDHYRCLFSIAAPIKIYETIEDGNIPDSTLNAWTIGRDRLILNTSLSNERKTLALYPTIAASVTCFASSPTYPNRIAIGGGEGVLRIWDLSHPHTQYINMTQMFDKKFQKITSLAWHPTKDAVLAFGTADGRVGLTDPCGKKSPIYLVQFSTSTIHRLEWGPLNGDRGNFMLYTVTNGKLIGYHTEKLLDAPIIFELIDDVCHISWKPDCSVCAVATKAGHVYLYTTELKLITTFYIQHKAVHCMAWHPQATVEDEDVSPYANWLAVGTNDVTVYDCALTDDGAKEQEISDRVVAVFKGPSKTIDSLSWNTFEGGKLASASCDGIAMVWDVVKKILLHTCGPFIADCLLTVLWSPLDPNYILTGSKNSIIHIWKLSEHPPVEKIVKKNNRRKPLSAALEGSEQSDVPSLCSNVDDENYIERIEKPKKSSRRYVLSGLIEAQNHNLKTMLLEDCKRLYALHYGNGAIEETEEIHDEICEENLHIDVIKIFGNEEDLEELFNLELRYHSRNSKKEIIDGNTHISLWRGDIGSCIKNAIKAKTLTEFSVSMAPTVSHELYLEACKAYAKQLSEDVNANPYKVAAYYLACHEVESAIKALCTFKNYLEAYVLAKCRLVSTDPLISEVLLRWAEHCEFTGYYEIAAQCYIVLHQLEDAVKILSRRTDRKTLEFCAKAAEHCKNKELFDAITFRLSVLDSKCPKEEEVQVKPLLTRAELEIQQCSNKNENVNGNDLKNDIHGSSKLLSNTEPACKDNSVASSSNDQIANIQSEKEKPNVRNSDETEEIDVNIDVEN